MRAIKHIVLHCSATDQIATVDSIKKYWREKLGWKSPGYHIIIKPNGDTVQLLPFDQISNGVKGHNSTSINICYIGGKTIDDRTEAQKKAMERIVKVLKTQYPKAEVLGHRDFPKVAKACPRFDARKWWASLPILLLFLSSCSADWHLQRAIIKDPSLMTKGSSIEYVDTIKIPINSYNLIDSVVFTYDTLTIDSINVIKENIPQETAERIRRRIIEQYNRLLEQDTATVDTFKISAFAYFKNGKLFVEFTQLNDTTIAIAKGKILCPPIIKYTPLNWWQRYGVALIILLTLLILFFSYIYDKIRL